MILGIIPVFARQRLVGYTWAVTSLMAIAFISFGVWVHHMFATGMPAASMGAFSAASQIIAIPSGVLYLVWIATMIQGKIRWTTPMLFSIGFLIIFLIGGLSGVMVSVMPFNLQVTDSYFIVAHFHYVLNGAVVFPIFGALYYWLPKATGRMLSEKWGKISFWTMFVGFNLSFFPMHILGLLGMPRRVYTYSAGAGWETLNIIITIGGFMFGLGTLMSLINYAWSRRHGEVAGPNPWGADTLEWAIPSPPPEWNFARPPVVRSRHPLWDDPPVVMAGDAEGDAAERALGEVGAAERTMAVTDGMDTTPEGVLRIPVPSVVPLVAAVGIAVIFLGLLVSAAVVGAIGAGALVVGAGIWIWRAGDVDPDLVEPADEVLS